MMSCLLTLAALLGTGVSSQLAASSGALKMSAKHYVRCSGNRVFGIEEVGSKMIVTLKDKVMQLNRKNSSLAHRYEGGGTFLMIDGEFVAFVPKGDASWKDCRLTKR